jgi:hypothetical protein
VERREERGKTGPAPAELVFAGAFVLSLKAGIPDGPARGSFAVLRPILSASGRRAPPPGFHAARVLVERFFMSDDIDAKTRAAERAERAERMAREGQQAMAEHLAAVKAVDERTVRLRALRLAKEAEEAAERAANPPAPKRGRKKATA